MDWRDGLEGVLDENDESDTRSGEDVGHKNEQGEMERENKTGQDRDRRKRRDELRYTETAALGRTRAGTMPAIPPPARQGERGAGVVGDTRWFLGLARRILTQ